MSEDRDRFNVAVRVRPLNKHDRDRGAEEVVTVLQDEMIVITPPSNANDDYLRQNRTREKQFAFDSVFDHKSNQVDVFQATTHPLIEDVLGGYNATVFAYGPTGSGKTFTMLGTTEQPGVMVLTLKELFEQVERENGILTKVTISYLEVYNENIRDLLSTSTENLDLREDPLKGISVAGIRDFTVSSAEEVMQLLQKGNKNRTTEPTKANETSSRSHAVCQVTVERKDKTANIKANIRIGKLSLIDLAGSERAVNTENRGIRLQEGANINRSLLALANCINALGDKKKKGAFVPYRDSKLTRLLKDSLGGNCRTVMITCISPSSISFEEIINTLKYANRAKNIKVKPTSNVKNVTYHIKEYQQIIDDLRNEIFELKQQISGNNKPHTEEREHSQYDSIREQKDFNEIQKALIEAFNDKMQLRKSLIELEDTNSSAKFEIEKKQEEIQQWEKENPGKEKDETNQTTLEEIKIMQVNIKENDIRKGQLQKQVSELESSSKKLREEFPRKITKQERRNLLSLLIQTQNLELQNMELEIQLQIRDNIISDQFKLLKEHKLENIVCYDNYPIQVDAIQNYSRASTAQPNKPNTARQQPNQIKVTKLELHKVKTTDQKSAFQSARSQTSAQRAFSAPNATPKRPQNSVITSSRSNFSIDSNLSEPKLLPELDKKKRNKKKKPPSQQGHRLQPIQHKYQTHQQQQHSSDHLIQPLNQPLRKEQLKHQENQVNNLHINGNGHINRFGWKAKT